MAEIKCASACHPKLVLYSLRAEPCCAWFESISWEAVDCAAAGQTCPGIVHVQSSALCDVNGGASASNATICIYGCWICVHNVCLLPRQVVNLHYLLSKTVVKARPTVLWCYKTDLYLSRCYFTPNLYYNAAIESSAQAFQQVRSNFSFVIESMINKACSLRSNPKP